MKFRPRAIVAALATALLAGVGSQVAAAPQFTINIGALTGGAEDLRTGEFFSGTSSELLEAIGNTHQGTGWLQINDLAIYDAGGGSAGSVAKFGVDTVNPGLYVTFTLESELISGTINTPGSEYRLTTLDFVLWVDPSGAGGNRNSFTAASLTPLTEASVTDTTGDDYVLGFGSLISGSAGLTEPEGGVGAHLNSINTFAVCNGAGSADLGGEAVSSDLCTNGTGAAFFVDPVPFYNIALTEFNNTGQGIQLSEQYVAITSATGGVDFNRVPAPGALALLGIGLVGLSIVRRREAK